MRRYLRNFSPVVAILITAMASCAPFPELDGTIDQVARDAPYPTLVNLNQLTSLTAPASNASINEDIAARLANLATRADRLRGPVIDPETRRRIARGI